MIIGLTGAAGCGKDTLANYLVIDGSWGKYSFASPLKRGLSEMLNIPMDDIENPLVKNEPNYKFGKSIRYMMQSIGTEWGRGMISDDIWVSLAKENILTLKNRHAGVVVSDVRFPNEANMIRDMGGFIIKITRDTDHYLNGIAGHQSEAGIPDSKVDYVVENNYTRKWFFDQVEVAIADMCMKR